MVENEKERLKKRRESAQANDCWQYREEPPSNWFTPLPSTFTSELLETSEGDKKKSTTFFERLYSRLID